MTSTPDSTLLCPACAGQNAPDSKFCRHCGHALSGAAVAVAAPVVNAAPVNSAAPVDSAVPVAIASEPLSFSGEIEMPDDVLPAMDGSVSDSLTDDAVMSSPAEIDARRAKHSLERAQGLTERGDTAGAILACRQALALAPAIAGGQAMLGALLERTGDLTHAMQAFEKAAGLAPEGGAARDLARLRDKMGVPPENAPIFHFDDDELFGDETSPAAPKTVPPKTVPATTSEAEPAAPIAVAGAAPEAVSAEAPGVEAQSASAAEVALATDGETAASAVSPHDPAVVAAAGTPAVTIVNEVSDVAPTVMASMVATMPVQERRVASVPVRVERRVSASVSMSATPIGARIQAPAAARAINPALLVGSEAKPQGWSALWTRPSYFARSLPLVGATILSLGFLSWARGLADARNLASASTVVVAQTQNGLSPVAPATTTGNSNLPALAPVGSAPTTGGGFPISNQPPGTVATPPLTPSAAPIAPAARPVLPAQPAPRRAPRSLPSISPAPISSLGVVRPTATRSTGGLTLPPPVISPPEPASPPQSVLPPSDAGALNPAGSPGSGYVRITRGRVGSILPQRPAGRASDAERAAAAAARGGSTPQAISGLTTAINANSNDAGFLFQQRAMLFLGQGDYARAADDFQSSISAYNDQIARGESGRIGARGPERRAQRPQPGPRRWPLNRAWRNPAAAQRRSLGGLASAIKRDAKRRWEIPNRE